MELTPENEAFIDGLSYEELLRKWRQAPLGDDWFLGATGDHWVARMKQLRNQGADHVGASKRIG